MQEPSAQELVDYAALLANGHDLPSVIAYLSEELPYLWRDAYLAVTPRLINIQRIHLGTFEYLYDDLDTLEALGQVPTSATAESRLVGVLGLPPPPARTRRSPAQGIHRTYQ